MAEATAEAFRQANDDYARAHIGGMSEIDGRIIGGNDRTNWSERRTSGTTNLSNFFGEDVSFYRAESDALSQACLWKILSMGKEISTVIGSKTAQELARAYSDSIIDWTKAVNGQRDEVSKSISDIFSDGVETWSEKDQLKTYLDSLSSELARSDLPINLRADIGKLKSDVQGAIDGINPNIPLKVSWEDLSTEAGREMWRLQHPEISSKLTFAGSEEFLKTYDALEEKANLGDASANLFIFRWYFADTIYIF
jgi:hypothetical protein